jgi:hypothetical protein
VDGSGNLLVGKTGTANLGSDTTAGHTLYELGIARHVASNSPSLQLTRTSSDGDIAVFTKDGTTVGSIGSKLSTSGSVMLIGSGDTGIAFENLVLRPRETDNGTSDGAIDLGTSSDRFKDLYLSGKTYLNTTSGAQLVLQTDATRGFIGTSTSHDLILETAATERMRIESDGSLLVGNTTNNSTIFRDHVIQGTGDSAGIGAIGLYNEAGTANAPVVAIASRDTSTNSTCRFIQFWNNVTTTTENAMGGIVGNGSTNVAFATISDEREKENITPVVGALDKLMNLNVVSFDWKKHDDHVEAGFIAQNVEEYFPEYVVENMSREGEEPRKGTTGGMSQGYIAVLTKAIQEQQAQIEALQSEINLLKGE